MYIKKLLLLFLAILFTCFMGCSRFNAKGNKGDSVVLPIKKEIDNYIVEIEDTKLFKDYILCKYNVTTKDGSEINKGDISVFPLCKYNNITYGAGGEIFRENVQPNKVVVFSEFFIGAKKGDSLKTKYLVGIKKCNSDTFIDGPYLKESKENYDYINKRFSIDNMDLVLQSKGDFEFGSLIHFYIENITDFDRIPEDYSIKISSGNYENSYRIRNATACGEDYIDRLIKDGGYREGMKSIGFYKCPLIYDNKKVDPNNIKIYLVNKETKVETLLYSK